MFISEILLVDWKAYEAVTLRFRCSSKTPIALIGAHNGVGKTSLLEALILCIYGRDGLGVLARSGGAAQQQSYSSFLEKAFHSGAIGAGRTSMRVRVTFQTDDSDKLAVEREWYFDGKGKHKKADDEVRLFAGEDLDIVRYPRSTTDQDEFARSWISTKILPSSLAGFFLFDGEIVQRLADQSMGQQVKHGIEGLLGVPLLRELRQDLLQYAQAKRQSAGSVDQTGRSELLDRIQTLEQQKLKADRAQAEASDALYLAEQERSSLVDRLGALAGGAATETLRALHERREMHRLDRAKLRDELNDILSTDLALALIPSGLCMQLARQLQGELSHEEWRRSKAQSTQLDRLLDRCAEGFSDIQPPLQHQQLTAAASAVRDAWESLWFPPPANAIEHAHHSYLTESQKHLIHSYLGERELGRIRKLQQLVSDVQHADTEIRRIESQISERPGDDVVEALKEQLRIAVQKHDSMMRARDSASREYEALAAQLNAERASLAQIEARITNNQPDIDKADMAERYAQLVDRIIERAVPDRIDEVAVRMTEAFKSIAHKGVVKSIQIDDDCSVRLLGPSNRDLRDYDLSAGEAQVFALSLISAIIQVAGYPFPIVMDTPIARLDDLHRVNMLQHFAGLPGQQLILLSQPTEVTGQYLDAIRKKVGDAYTIKFKAGDDGLGRSRIVDGYFDERLN